MNTTNESAGQHAENPDPVDGGPAEFAEILGAGEFEIIAEAPRRIRPATRSTSFRRAQRTASPVVDSTDSLCRRRRLNTLAGPELFTQRCTFPEHLHRSQSSPS
jgi:hypothetical protein